MAYMKAGVDDFAKMRDDYRKHSDNIEQIVRMLDSSLKSSIWEGQAKSRFENDWNTIHKPNLQKLRQALTDCSQELESRRSWTEQFETTGAR
jgi:WXG100 family type VII secretion target